MSGGRLDNSQNPGAPCDIDGPGVFWSWSLGDACLARYWEDERVSVEDCSKKWPICSGPLSGES